MKLRTADELHNSLQSLFVTLEEDFGFSEQGEAMHLESLHYLAKKQMHFEGMAYFEQVEKNAIYLFESYLAMCQALARFLCEGIPRLKSSDIELFVTGLRSIPQKYGDHQWNYVRFGCNGCPVHDYHQRWSTLYRQRRELPHADYMEELEFSLLFYQMRFMLAQMYLKVILDNHQWAGVARRIHPTEVTSVIWRDINARGDLFSGTFELRLSGKITSPKPTWRELWGNQFDQIVQEMHRDRRFEVFEL